MLSKNLDGPITAVVECTVTDAMYSGISHVVFSVTDLDPSKNWYERVLGWQQLVAGEDAGTRFAVGAMAGNFLVGLRQHPNGSGDRFDPRRDRP